MQSLRRALSPVPAGVQQLSIASVTAYLGNCVPVSIRRGGVGGNGPEGRPRGGHEGIAPERGDRAPPQSPRKHCAVRRSTAVMEMGEVPQDLEDEHWWASRTEVGDPVSGSRADNLVPAGPCSSRCPTQPKTTFFSCVPTVAGTHHCSDVKMAIAFGLKIAPSATKLARNTELHLSPDKRALRHRPRSARDLSLVWAPDLSRRDEAYCIFLHVALNLAFWCMSIYYSYMGPRPASS